MKGDRAMIIYGDLRTGVQTITYVVAEVLAGAARLARRKTLSVYNDGAKNCYIVEADGDASVGYTLTPGDDFQVTFEMEHTYCPVYVVCAAGETTTVRVMETC